MAITLDGRAIVNACRNICKRSGKSVRDAALLRLSPATAIPMSLGAALDTHFVRNDTSRHEYFLLIKVGRVAEAELDSLREDNRKCTGDIHVRLNFEGSLRTLPTSSC